MEARLTNESESKSVKLYNRNELITELFDNDMIMTLSYCDKLVANLDSFK